MSNQPKTIFNFSVQPSTSRIDSLYQMSEKLDSELDKILLSSNIFGSQSSQRNESELFKRPSRPTQRPAPVAGYYRPTKASKLREHTSASRDSSRSAPATPTKRSLSRDTAKKKVEIPAKRPRSPKKDVPRLVTKQHVRAPPLRKTDVQHSTTKQLPSHGKKPAKRPLHEISNTSSTASSTLVSSDRPPTKPIRRLNTAKTSRRDASDSDDTGFLIKSAKGKPHRGEPLARRHGSGSDSEASSNRGGGTSDVDAFLRRLRNEAPVKLHVLPTTTPATRRSPELRTTGADEYNVWSILKRATAEREERERLQQAEERRRLRPAAFTDQSVAGFSTDAHRSKPLKTAASKKPIESNTLQANHLSYSSAERNFETFATDKNVITSDRSSSTVEYAELPVTGGEHLIPSMALLPQALTPNMTQQAAKTVSKSSDATAPEAVSVPDFAHQSAPQEDLYGVSRAAKMYDQLLMETVLVKQKYTRKERLDDGEASSSDQFAEVVTNGGICKGDASKKESHHVSWKERSTDESSSKSNLAPSNGNAVQNEATLHRRNQAPSPPPPPTWVDQGDSVLSAAGALSVRFTAELHRLAGLQEASLHVERTESLLARQQEQAHAQQMKNVLEKASSEVAAIREKERLVEKLKKPDVKESTDEIGTFTPHKPRSKELHDQNVQSTPTKIATIGHVQLAPPDVKLSPRGAKISKLVESTGDGRRKKSIDSFDNGSIEEDYLESEHHSVPRIEHQTPTRDLDATLVPESEDALKFDTPQKSSPEAAKPNEDVKVVFSGPYSPVGSTGSSTVTEMSFDVDLLPVRERSADVMSAKVKTPPTKDVARPEANLTQRGEKIRQLVDKSVQFGGVALDGVSTQTDWSEVGLHREMYCELHAELRERMQRLENEAREERLRTERQARSDAFPAQLDRFGNSPQHEPPPRRRAADKSPVERRHHHHRRSAELDSDFSVTSSVSVSDVSSYRDESSHDDAPRKQKKAHEAPRAKQVESKGAEARKSRSSRARDDLHPRRLFALIQKQEREVALLRQIINNLLSAPPTIRETLAAPPAASMTPPAPSAQTPLAKLPRTPESASPRTEELLSDCEVYRRGKAEKLVRDGFLELEKASRDLSSLPPIFDQSLPSPRKPGDEQARRKLVDLSPRALEALRAQVSAQRDADSAARTMESTDAAAAREMAERALFERLAIEDMRLRSVGAPETPAGPVDLLVSPRIRSPSERSLRRAGSDSRQGSVDSSATPTDEPAAFGEPLRGDLADRLRKDASSRNLTPELPTKQPLPPDSPKRHEELVLSLSDLEPSDRPKLMTDLRSLSDMETSHDERTPRPPDTSAVVPAQPVEFASPVVSEEVPPPVKSAADSEAGTYRSELMSSIHGIEDLMAVDDLGLVRSDSGEATAPVSDTAPPSGSVQPAQTLSDLKMDLRPQASAADDSSVQTALDTGRTSRSVTSVRTDESIKEEAASEVAVVKTEPDVSVKSAKSVEEDVRDEYTMEETAIDSEAVSTASDPSLTEAMSRTGSRLSASRADTVADQSDVSHSSDDEVVSSGAASTAKGSDEEVDDRDVFYGKGRIVAERYDEGSSENVVIEEKRDESIDSIREPMPSAKEPIPAAQSPVLERPQSRGLSKSVSFEDEKVLLKSEQLSRASKSESDEQLEVDAPQEKSLSEVVTAAENSESIAACVLDLRPDSQQHPSSPKDSVPVELHPVGVEENLDADKEFSEKDVEVFSYSDASFDAESDKSETLSIDNVQTTSDKAQDVKVASADVTDEKWNDIAAKLKLDEEVDSVDDDDTPRTAQDESDASDLMMKLDATIIPPDVDKTKEDESKPIAQTSTVSKPDVTSTRKVFSPDDTDHDITELDMVRSEADSVATIDESAMSDLNDVDYFEEIDTLTAKVSVIASKTEIAEVNESEIHVEPKIYTATEGDMADIYLENLADIADISIDVAVVSSQEHVVDKPSSIVQYEQHVHFCDAPKDDALLDNDAAKSLISTADFTLNRSSEFGDASYIEELMGQINSDDQKQLEILHQSESPVATERNHDDDDIQRVESVFEDSISEENLSGFSDIQGDAKRLAVELESVSERESSSRENMIGRWIGNEIDKAIEIVKENREKASTNVDETLPTSVVPDNVDDVKLALDAAVLRIEAEFGVFADGDEYDSAEEQYGEDELADDEAGNLLDLLSGARQDASDEVKASERLNSVAAEIFDDLVNESLEAMLPLIAGEIREVAGETNIDDLLDDEVGERKLLDIIADSVDAVQAEAQKESSKSTESSERITPPTEPTTSDVAEVVTSSSKSDTPISSDSPKNEPVKSFLADLPSLTSDVGVVAADFDLEQLIGTTPEEAETNSSPRKEPKRRGHVRNDSWPPPDPTLDDELTHPSLLGGEWDDTDSRELARPSAPLPPPLADDAYVADPATVKEWVRLSLGAIEARQSRSEALFEASPTTASDETERQRTARRSLQMLVFDLTADYERQAVSARKRGPLASLLARPVNVEQRVLAAVCPERHTRPAQVNPSKQTIRPWRPSTRRLQHRTYDSIERLLYEQLVAEEQSWIDISAVEGEVKERIVDGIMTDLVGEVGAMVDTVQGSVE